MFTWCGGEKTRFQLFFFEALGTLIIIIATCGNAEEEVLSLSLPAIHHVLPRLGKKYILFFYFVMCIKRKMSGVLSLVH